MSTQHFTLPRRFIIDTHGCVKAFRDLLPHLTTDVTRAFHEIMYVAVESIRYRDRATVDISRMLGSFEMAMEYGMSHKAEIVEALDELTWEMFYQTQSYRLYNKDGLLMYTYFPHPDPEFDDIILHPIIQLTYNPTVPCYELPIY